MRHSETGGALTCALSKGGKMQRGGGTSIKVLLVAQILVFSGCAELANRMNSPARPTLPVSDQGFTTLPFKKVINPAFHDEVANKWIRFTANFMSVVQVVTDLPTEYQNDYVRFGVIDQADFSAASNDFVLAKKDSEILFNLKGRDEIEVFALVVPTVSTNRFGRQSTGVLFVVDKVNRSTSTSAKLKTGRDFEPKNREILTSDSKQVAYSKCLKVLLTMGASIDSQDSAQGVISSKLHNAVSLVVIITDGDGGKMKVLVAGSVNAGKVVTGEFTEVDDFVRSYEKLK